MLKRNDSSMLGVSKFFMFSEILHEVIFQSRYLYIWYKLSFCYTPKFLSPKITDLLFYHVSYLLLIMWFFVNSLHNSGRITLLCPLSTFNYIYFQAIPPSVVSEPPPPPHFHVLWFRVNFEHTLQD